MTNNDLRRRKLADKNGRPPTAKKTKKSSKKQGITIQTSLLCLILSGVLTTTVVVLYTDTIPWHLGHRTLDQLAKTLGYYHEPVHAVVIDAGSTGSRVLAYTFHKSVWDGHLVLDKELFEYTKPGLSSFADNPKEGVKTISNLIEKAKREIPDQYWKETPIVLQATAGLRLLPPAKAEALLQACRDLFSEIPFITNENSIGIMDGTDEGIFSWFTVNFLNERLNHQPARTLAALDLGGGSTQVTFAASTPDTLKEREFIHQAAAPKGRVSVYTNSYLGLGLMAARKAILLRGQKEEARDITSDCVNPVIKSRKFSYGGTDYFISGLASKYPTRKIKGDAITVGETIPVVDYDKCNQYLVEYVRSKPAPPSELQDQPIFAFSYYFDRASEAGLIDENTGGSVLVQDFAIAAKKACNEANTDQPFMCFDLNFISVLLEKGFNLAPKSKIFLFKKVNGHEISWALGAAYNMLAAQLQQQ